MNMNMDDPPTNVSSEWLSNELAAAQSQLQAKERSIKRMEEEDDASASSEETDDEENEDASASGEGDDEDSPGDNMNALIKAAAIWLTETDEKSEPGKKSSSRGRALPGSGKRSAQSGTPSPVARGKGGRGSSLTSGKRRRVHF